jgi:hypothetical protein
MVIKMKIKLLIILIVLFAQTSFSQWSTSSYADSSLYVCPGFYPGLVTFNDGSSIVLGMLESYIFAQKLNPYGYKMWNEPVVVHHNDSSQMSIPSPSEMTWFCSDGDGGVIVFWHDYRDAYYVINEPFLEWKNNSIYLQRIDKHGNKRWGENGIKVSGIEEGLKQTRITSDGNSGCVLLLSETGFNYPDAPNKNYLKTERYSSEGERLWHTVLDSSFTINTQFQLHTLIRGGEYYYFNYLVYPTDFQKLIKEDGDINTYRNLPITAIAEPIHQKYIFSNDYLTFNKTYLVSKYGSKGDTLWTTSVYYGDKCPDVGGYLLPDNKEGTYLMYVCQDSIMYFDSLGNFSYKEFNSISNYSDYFFSEGIIAVSSTITQRFDTNGTSLWQNEVTYLSDPENAYHQYIKPDNNGGLIITFWTTFGAIFAKHTGRYGELGIITDIKAITNNIPEDFELLQNYPNPFNPITTIKFSIKVRSAIRISIINILGQKINDLVNEELGPGSYEVKWNAKDYSSGVYFYSLIVNSNPVAVKKLMFIK